MTALLLRDAELDGRTRADVRISDGRITEIAGSLTRRAGEAEHDCHGGALLPGLCDHHLHLHALAAAERSVRCGPPAVTDRAGLGAALAAARPDAHGWIRGVSYFETVAGDLDAAGLDRLCPDRPVRVQHRSGALWMLNTAAASAVGLASADHPGIERTPGGVPTGRLWRADAWLRAHLPPAPPDLAPVGARLARLGITAVSDATPELEDGAAEAIADALRDGALPQRVQLLGAPLGAVPPGDLPRLGIGPYKIMIADSALPSLPELTRQISAVHATGRAIAAHCVTREALVILLAALAEAGTLPGDRIEHAALVPAELVPELAHRRLRVVTQPGFLAHRGDDYLRDVPGGEHIDLYRCASLTAAGVRLALSSDAPYGPLDPWEVMAAAVHRRTPAGRVAGPGERLTPGLALAAYLAPPHDPGGPARRVRTGADADLVLLSVPLATALSAPDTDLVRLVLAGGRVVAGG
ncbi:amidohydrolase family protein [Actinomadura scrupuli]|uniref:amidohydrolase family protein n=1 Tax=Actinomadura scrupuli TaxID=559629 RepID=UPI003D99A589